TFSRTNERQTTVEESVEVGYTIYDDDITDAFSVAVIQGADQFHTPYFEQFGGHTSCPPEAGTVWVDNPLISILDPETGATSDTKELFNVPADEAAVFRIVIENQTPLASLPDRETVVFLENENNDNGAVIKLNGIDLSVANFMDSLAAFEPDTLTLTIERGPVFYDYEDIKIGIQPSCDDEGPKRFIFVSAHFQTPCSPVTIVTPDPNWLINGDDNFIQIGIQDYDAGNINLNEVVVEYRRLANGMDWTPVPLLELGLDGIVDTTTLIDYNSTIAQGQIPIFYFDWTLPDDMIAYPDGDYEIRVRMDCGASANISNVIPGRIAREGVFLFGDPEPADQIWTAGDEISFTFNKELDCALLNQPFQDRNISIVNNSNGDTLDYSMTCFNNKMIFILDQAMSNFDGDYLTVTVDSIPAITGNISQQESWTFRVVTQTVYWSAGDTVKIQLYKDEMTSINLRLDNSTNVITETVGLEAADGAFDPWLNITNPINLNIIPVPPFGTGVSIDITANQEVGIYNEQINVTGLLGNIPELHIQLEVLSRPPDWEIDPNDFTKSMNLIANWKFVMDPDDAISTDTTDLISVWVGDELRGVANVTKSGSNYFAAYLQVFGKDSDPSPLNLDFRVWDAAEGVEYIANPTSNVVFIENGNVGTTDDPEILNVDAVASQIRYIPLRNGWTGFSLNAVSDDMSINEVLKSLSNVTDGDIIKTSNAFAMYSSTEGWYNLGTNKLDEIQTSTGYMIYLQNGPDTITISGALPATNEVSLYEGWNWLGYPFDTSMETAMAFDHSNATGIDILKVDYPLPDSLPQTAQYDLINDAWLGSVDQMHPYHLYKLYVANPNGGVLSWSNGNGANASPGSQVEIADPDDPSTWTIDNYNADKVMQVVAEIYIDSTLDVNIGDKVAFFKNDTLHGVSYIQEANAFGKFVITALVEFTAGDYDILLYDSNENQSYRATQSISYGEEGYGSFQNPYRLDFEACVRNLMLTTDNSPLLGTYEASETITIMGNVDIMNGETIILKAPVVRVIDQVHAMPASQIIIQPDGCQ
ncbi:MAG: hypothetical protein AAGK97_03210, partial [Bacteroidota bacterium]